MTTKQLGLDIAEQAVQRFDLSALSGLDNTGYVAIDIETETRYAGIGPKTDFGLSYSAPITTISFAWLNSLNKAQTASLYASNGAWLIEIQNYLIDLFSSHMVIAHNAVFDMRQLSKLTGGKVPDQVWCTMTMERLIAPAVNKRYGLVEVAKAHGILVSEAQTAMKAQRGKLHTLPLAEVLAYAEADARLALEIYISQQGMVKTDVQQELVEWECKAVRAYCAMAATGVRINREYIQSRLIELAQTITATLERLQADGLDNPGSSVQRIKYIYEIKGLPRPAQDDPDKAIFFTAGGGLSAGGDVVDLLAKRSPEHAEILKDLITWLECDRMLSTFSTLLDHAESDGRIHSLISIQTETGRRASQHPNLQNWKMASGGADDLAGTMCGAAIADDDQSTLVEIDFSNAENWMAALIAGDDNLAAACASADFHSAMAERYFGDRWQKADKAERKRLRFQGKGITFGTAYGAGAKRIAQGLKCTVNEAQALLDAKDQAFAQVASTKREAMKKAVGTGFVRLWTGRRVPVDAEKSYTAWNFLCQGGVAEILKRAIVMISETYIEQDLKSRVAIDIHDSVVISVRHDEWDQAITIAAQIMASIVPDALNERTVPPIRWIAEPDLAENSKKWGAGQYHPEKPIEEPVQQIVEKPVVAPVNPTTKLLTICYPDLNWEYSLPVRVDGDHLYADQPEGAQHMLLALLKRLDQEFDKTFKVRPPKVVDNEIVWGDEVTVDQENYPKIPAMWYQAADKCDVKAITGFTKDELASEYLKRTECLGRLLRLLENVLARMRKYDFEYKEYQNA